MKRNPARLTKARYRISTQARRMDIKLIHEFLRGTYWAKGIPRNVVVRSIRNSLCFGAFYRGRQIGFGRVITDRATFAYVADVFVVPEHRGRGVAQMILRAMLNHRQLQGLRSWMIATLDAHRLYQKFDFAPLSNPERYLKIHRPNVYQTPVKRRMPAPPPDRKTAFKN